MADTRRVLHYVTITFVTIEMLTVYSILLLFIHGVRLLSTIVVALSLGRPQWGFILDSPLDPHVDSSGIPFGIYTTGSDKN